MGLYFTVFSGDEEEAGWVMGHYSDFGFFRDTIEKYAEKDDFPVLMEHSDCDGEWSVSELLDLKTELESLRKAFQSLPPIDIHGAFEHTAEFRKNPQDLLSCFHNVDGENLIAALINLCDTAISLDQPILFQ